VEEVAEAAVEEAVSAIDEPVLVEAPEAGYTLTLCMLVLH